MADENEVAPSAEPNDWRSQLSPELQNDANLQNFKSPDDLAKSYISTKKMVGDPAVLRPPAEPEKLDEWRKGMMPKLAELGLAELPPESPDKYEIKFDGLDSKQLMGDKLLTKFRDYAHKQGLSNAKVQGLIEHFAKDLLPDVVAGLKPPDPEFIEGDAVKNLAQQKFGIEATKRLKDYEYALSNMRSEYPELEDMLKDSYTRYGDKWISFFDHPAMVGFFSDLGDKMKNDFSGNFSSILQAGDSLESIDTEIANLRNNKDLPSEEVGRRLVPLYEKKSVLLKRNGR